jgi:hypothetical protein
LTGPNIDLTEATDVLRKQSGRSRKRKSRHARRNPIGEEDSRTNPRQKAVFIRYFIVGRRLNPRRDLRHVEESKAGGFPMVEHDPLARSTCRISAS